MTCSNVCGFFLFLMGLLGLGIYWLFTPVYKPIECDLVGGVFDGFQIPGAPVLPFPIPFFSPSEKAGVSIRINVQCNNPNPISVHAHRSTGTVYAGPEMTNMGTVEVFPQTYMPAWSNGSIYSKATLVFDQALWQTVLPQMLLGNEIPIRIKFAMTADLSMPFLLGASVTTTIRKSCGMNVKSVIDLITDPSGHVVGPMACADSFDDLDIPPTDAEDKTKKTLEMAERVKDVVSISMMIIGFILGPLLMCRGADPRGCFRCCRRHAAREAEIPGVKAQEICMSTQAAASTSRGDEGILNV